MTNLKLAAAAAALLMTVGCASSGQKTDVPDMPNFTTKEEKACARQCQAIYAESNESCSLMVGGARTAKQRAQCLDGANTNLANCYRTCQ
jgi:hypothetical protein